MTAEIAVMNKQAIALAADSAVTMLDEDGEKIFPSANKIFALSKHEPVAAMIYGNAGMMGVPWESTVKIFRHELGRTRYSTVQQYGQKLLGYLKSNRQLFPKPQCESFTAIHVVQTFESVFIGATYKAQERTGNLEADPEAQDFEVIVPVLAEAWRKAPHLQDVSAAHTKKVRARYAAKVKRWRDDAFHSLSLSPKTMRALLDIGLACITKCPPRYLWPSTSGIVVAGFGTSEFFPSVRAYSLQGIFDGRLHYRDDKGGDITFSNESAIYPFAQGDMVYTFMEGIDPDYQRAIENDMVDLLRQYPAEIIDNCNFIDDATKAKLKQQFAGAITTIARTYAKGLGEFRQRRFAAPVLRLVSMMPKSELAILAESMVNLTALRRKMSTEAETVGGPIDVAVISKGDGLIWIKRKHYFEPALNHQFFDNYYEPVKP